MQVLDSIVFKRDQIRSLRGYKHQMKKINNFSSLHMLTNKKYIY
jgi:hypothetical protein